MTRKKKGLDQFQATLAERMAADSTSVAEPVEDLDTAQPQAEEELAEQNHELEVAEVAEPLVEEPVDEDINEEIDDELDDEELEEDFDEDFDDELDDFEDEVDEMLDDIEPEPDSDIESEVEPEVIEQPALIEQPAVAAKTRKPGLWSRFKQGWAKRFGRKAKREAAAASAAAPVDPSQRLSEALKELAAAHDAASAASLRAENSQALIHEIETEQAKLAAWAENLERSYFFKIETRMRENLERNRADIAEYESLVQSLELPQKGKLVELRKKFHKNLIANTLVFGIPAALMFLIPWFSKLSLVQWLVDFLRSPLFAVFVVTLVAFTAGVILLFRRILGEVKVTKKRSLKYLLVSALLPLAGYGIFALQGWLLRNATPVIEQIRPLSLWTIAIIYFFAVLAALIIYYRGWSIFRRTVTDELNRLENVAAGYVKTRQELARLEFLYAQTTSWMKIIAHTLYRPWKVHPDWRNSSPAQASSESFPMSLRVAQAIETDVAESAQLRRLIAQRLLVQGWRSEVFDKTLEQIGKRLGYAKDQITPELLDADLPHQPNGSRKLVTDHFDYSASTAAEGILNINNPANATSLVTTNPEPDDNYLVEVARDHLLMLIEKTQGSALTEARPSVQQVVQNPLIELLSSDYDEQSQLQVFDWDQFLQSALGIEDVTQPPMGTLAFSAEGHKANAGAGPVSKILVPERFEKSLPAPKAKSVEVVSVGSTQPQNPAEIILRFDVVGPLAFSHVQLIQNSRVASMPQQSQQDEDDFNDDL